MTITPSLFVDNDSVGAPTAVPGTRTLFANTLPTSGLVFYIPTVARGIVVGSVVNAADNFSSPAVTPGPVTLSPARVLPDDFINAIDGAIKPLIVASDDATLAPRLSAGGVSEVYSDADTFHVPFSYQRRVVRSSQTIFGKRANNELSGGANQVSLRAERQTGRTLLGSKTQ